MVRQGIAASAALIVVIALPSAPRAAADADQLVGSQSGKILCLVSADNVSLGGGPIVACQQSEGQPFGQAPWASSKNSVRLNRAVVRGTGEFFFDLGSVPGWAGTTAQDVNVDSEQANINGWTIQSDETSTRFTYDATGHGMSISPEYIRSY
jgi:hypothetical protein